jgi:hypothetical protein
LIIHVSPSNIIIRIRKASVPLEIGIEIVFEHSVIPVKAFDLSQPLFPCTMVDGMDEICLSSRRAVISRSMEEVVGVVWNLVFFSRSVHALVVVDSTPAASRPWILAKGFSGSLRAASVGNMP